MRRFTMNQDIAGSAADHWRLFLDEEFDRRQYLEFLGFPAYQLLEGRDTDTHTLRKIRVQPKLDVPAAVAKLLGSSFGYVEEGSFDKRTQVWRSRIVPNVLADRLTSESVVRTEPVGEGRCRRVVELSVEARIFGLGGLIETALEKNLRDGWEKSATYMNRELQKKAPA